MLKMVDDLSIHVTFERQSHIFGKITQREFLDKVCGYFGLSTDEIELYEDGKDSLRKISIYDLKGIMKVRIMRKDNCVMANRQRSLKPYLEKGQSSKVPTIEESILEKLKKNSTLNGKERKHLADLLSRDYSEISLKRKRDDNTHAEPKQHANKKVQVSPVELKKFRDAFTQTEKSFATQALQNSLQDKNLTKKLKQMANENSASKEQISDIMAQTFCARRSFITVKIPSVVQVKEEYPLLFSLDEVKNEIDRIFYIGKSAEFIKNIEVYTPVILKIIEERDPDDAILVKTKRCLTVAPTQLQKKYAEEVGSLLLLPKLFNENPDFIKFLNNSIEPGMLPHIAVLENSIKPLFFDTLMYKIVVEGKQLCEAPTFQEAVLCLVASFFIFNIVYSPECMQTYIAFEKLLLEGNDTDDIDTDTEQMIKYIKLKASRLNS